MKVKVKSEQELLKVAEEAIQVIANLRKFTKLWEESYGVELKNRKKCWENLADNFIDRLQVIELKRHESIQIEINKNS